MPLRHVIALSSISLYLSFLLYTFPINLRHHCFTFYFFFKAILGAELHKPCSGEPYLLTWIYVSMLIYAHLKSGGRSRRWDKRHYWLQEAPRVSETRFAWHIPENSKFSKQVQESADNCIRRTVLRRVEPKVYVWHLLHMSRSNCIG